MMFGQLLNTHRIFKRLVKALIRQCDAQAGLSLCWSHIPCCWKIHVTAHFQLKAPLKDIFCDKSDIFVIYLHKKAILLILKACWWEIISWWTHNIDVKLTKDYNKALLCIPWFLVKSDKPDHVK